MKFTREEMSKLGLRRRYRRDYRGYTIMTSRDVANESSWSSTIGKVVAFAWEADPRSGVHAHGYKTKRAAIDRAIEIIDGWYDADLVIRAKQIWEFLDRIGPLPSDHSQGVGDAY